PAPAPSPPLPRHSPLLLPLHRPLRLLPRHSYSYSRSCSCSCSCSCSRRSSPCRRYWSPSPRSSSPHSFLRHLPRPPPLFSPHHHRSSRTKPPPPTSSRTNRIASIGHNTPHAHAPRASSL